MIHDGSCTNFCTLFSRTHQAQSSSSCTIFVHLGSAVSVLFLSKPLRSCEQFCPARPSSRVNRDLASWLGRSRRRSSRLWLFSPRGSRFPVFFHRRIVSNPPSLHSSRCTGVVITGAPDFHNGGSSFTLVAGCRLGSADVGWKTLLFPGLASFSSCVRQ